VCGHDDEVGAPVDRTGNVFVDQAGNSVSILRKTWSMTLRIQVKGRTAKP